MQPTVLTVRNIPRDVAAAIAKRAKANGQSLSRATIELLREALHPLKPAARPRPERAQVHDDLDHLIGSWSRQDQEELDESLRAQRTIDPRDWE